jgi:hypothetical protein
MKTGPAIQMVMVAFLLAGAGIHWMLPIIHPIEAPREMTEGMIAIPHELLHTLFLLYGVTSILLAALVTGWLAIKPLQQRWVYLAVIAVALSSIIGWVLLADTQGWLDLVDKVIEALLIVMSVWQIRQISSRRDININS